MASVNFIPQIYVHTYNIATYIQFFYDFIGSAFNYLCRNEFT